MIRPLVSAARRPRLARLDLVARRASLGAAGLAAAGALALPTAAQARGFTAHVHFSNHTPTMNRKWPIRFTATKGRRKLSGRTRYQFLLGSSVVASRNGVRFRHGAGHDSLVFPGAAVGHKLTLRVLIITRYGTDRIDWWVRTRR